MKVANLKRLLLANAPLTIISVVLGYSFWYIASYNQIVSLQMNVPLCFSAPVNDCSVHAPEIVAVTLTAPRSELYGLEQAALAAHINISKLLPGKHGIILMEQHLFLPKNITLTSYKPANLFITISENKKT